MQWIDNRFTWNKEDYGNIDIVYAPINMLWTPEILQYNSWVTSLLYHYIFTHFITFLTASRKMDWTHVSILNV